MCIRKNAPANAVPAAPQEQDKPKTFVPYVRDDEANAASIQRQLKICTDYTLSAGLVTSPTRGPVVDHCSSLVAPDERPGMGELLDVAGSGAFDVVLPVTLAAVSRDSHVVADILRSFDAAGVELHVLPHGRLNPDWNAFEEYLDRAVDARRREITAIGRRRFLELGRYMGRTPYAYAMTDTRGVLEIRQPQASTVSGMYADYAEGAAATEIAKGLNDAQVPSPSGGRWNAATVLALLRNPIHAGFMVQGCRAVRQVLRGGTLKRVRVSVPPNDWMCVEVPHLRIVELGLWKEVALQLQVRIPPGMISALLEAAE